MEAEKLSELELKAYREYHSDGHVEFIIGLGLIFLVGLGALFDLNEYCAVLIIGMVFLPILLWKDKIVVPRMGHVQFHPQIIKNETRQFAIVLGGFVVCITASLFIILTNEARFQIWFGSKDALAMLVIAMMMMFSFIGIGIARKANRHYLFAVVNVVAWLLSFRYRFDAAYVFLAVGLCMVLYGGGMLWKFFRTHPKLTEPIAEPEHQRAEDEFEQNNSYESAIHAYYSTSGLTEFSMVILYVLLGLGFWNTSLPIFFIILFALIFGAIWNFVIVRMKMGTEVYRIARKVQRSYYSPTINIAVMLPFMLLLISSKHASSAYGSIYDVLFLGCEMIMLVFFGKQLGIRTNLKPILYSAILYLALRSGSLPRMTVAIVAATAIGIVGIYRAIQFFRSETPQQAQAVEVS